MFRRWLAGVGGVVGVAAVAFAASGAPQANAAVSQAPTPTGPVNGATLSNFNPTLQWSLPSGAVQYHLEVAPANNDGPGVEVIANAAGSYTIPAPPTWFVLLPDMGYTWRVRASDAATSIGKTDPSWGPWSPPAVFRTPKVTAASIVAIDPPNGGAVTGFQPTLTWATEDAAIWYFEIQVSADPNFETDPAKATAAVYWELKHGDPGAPAATPYAYALTGDALLEAGKTYFWRVRPRVQGDGVETPWGQSYRFTTPAAAALYLDVSAPLDEAQTGQSSIMVTGRTRAGSVVSVVGPLTFEQITAEGSGAFSVQVGLEPGPNQMDVLATDPNTGETVALTRTVTYNP